MRKLVVILLIAGIIPLLVGCDGRRKETAPAVSASDFNFRGDYPATFKGEVNRSWWESIDGKPVEYLGKDDATLTFEEPDVVTLYGVHACYTNGCDIKPGDACGYTLKGKYELAHGISRFTLGNDTHNVYSCAGAGTYNSKKADIDHLKCTFNGDNRLIMNEVSLTIQ